MSFFCLQLFWVGVVVVAGAEKARGNSLHVACNVAHQCYFPGVECFPLFSLLTGAARS